MTQEELQEQYILYRTMLANANAAISAQLGKNKKYTYSNIESVHMAETNTLPELLKIVEYANGMMKSIEKQFTGPFIALKNY